MGLTKHNILQGDYTHNQHLPSILLIEHNISDLRLLLTEFRAHYSICVAANSEQAMQKLQQHGHFDFIVSYVTNDEDSLNPFCFYELLAQYESYKSIPFLFITDIDDEAFKRRIIKLGAIDSFARPLDAQLIRNRIDGILLLLQKQRHSIMNHIYRNRNQGYEQAQQGDAFKQLATTYNLTNKELEICRFIIEGHSYKKMASQLNVAVTTVKSHLQNISKKVPAKGRGKLSQVLLDLMNQRPINCLANSFLA